MDVLISDADPRVRSALRLFLEQIPEVGRVGEAQDKSELMLAVVHTHPDILLLDWHMEDERTPTLLDSLRNIEPYLRVVILSLSDEDCSQALAAGADAFVRKGDRSEELLLALGLGRSEHTSGLSD